jgi:superfamily II DNA or RNA helicase
MIKIEKINEVYIRVTSDDHGVLQEISQFFSFEMPGAKFTPQYRARLWDGIIRLYDLHRKTLYVGLLKYLQSFAERNEYEIEYLNEVEDKNDISVKEIKEFAEWLNLRGRGQPIEIYDYQIDAIHTALTDKRRLLLSPTSSGKSLIIYTTMRYLLEQGKKCIIVVPTTSLVEQLHSDFEDYSSANGWKVKHHCQKLYSGFSKDFESDVLITTWQSIHRQPAPWFKQFDVIFGDEAHNFKAKSLTGVMEKMTNVDYRIGTTGTLDDKKVHKLVLEGIFGSIYKVISTRELMDSNRVAALKITCIVLQYDETTRKITHKASYQDEMDHIVKHEKRNKFIRNLALNATGNTLVLFQYVEKHGKILYDMIKEKAHDKRKVFFIYGGTDVEAREAARKLAETESDAIFIASFGVFSTGINIPSIENVIFASPSKSKIRNLQSIGRGLRLKEGKTHCNLYDLSDDLHWKSWKNHTLGHFAERLKTYSEEKFDYKIVEVPIE